MEFFLPSLIDKYRFSDQINIIIDFNNQDVDTEFIKLIMYYFNLYYPLLINKINVFNFNLTNIETNFSFREELDSLNRFKVFFPYFSKLIFGANLTSTIL